MGRIDAFWGLEPVVVVGVGDFPVVVVEEEVVSSAEEDSVVDVGGSVVSVPVCDVVGFAPGGGSVAGGEHAASVAEGEGRCVGGW